MEVYPATPPPFDVYPFEEEYQTQTSMFQGSNEQSQMLRRFPVKKFSLSYDLIQIATEWSVIHNFYKTMFGGWARFWFFDFERRHWGDEYVGRGNGSTRVFDLHSKSIDPHLLSVLVNGSPVTFSFLPAGGQGGADVVVLDAAPVLGALITSTFDGNLRIKAVMQDRFSDSISARFVGMAKIETIVLREVHW